MIAAIFLLSVQPVLSLLLGIIFAAIVVVKNDKSGTWLIVFVLTLIVIAVNLLLVIGLAYVHKVFSG